MAQTPAIFKQKGDLIDHTPALAVAAGQVIEISNMPYVAPVAIPAGEKGTLAATGVFAVPKTSDTFTPGAAVYWNSSGTPVSGDASSGAADNATGNFMGLAVESDEYGDVTYGAATAAAAYVLCQLQPMKRVATSVADDPLSTTGISAADASLGIAGLTAAQGGAVAVVGGVSETAGNAGGAVSLTGGVGGATGAGGAASVVGGASGATSGVGGAASLTGGAAGSSAGNAVGGAAAVTGGIGKGTSAGGAASIVGGVGGATGAGGAVAVTGGAGGSSSGTGGAVTVTGGAGTAGNANGGAVSITGGAKHGSGANGAVNIGADKATVVTVGYASGKLYLVGLPTSDPTSANQVWANSNVLTLSAGG
jgi:predicted RecA/RadA family phage recombinase